MSFGGEQFDATKDDPNWCAIEESRSGWAPVEIFDLSRLVSAEVLEPNLAMHELRPLKIETLSDGAYRVDMGRNFAGWVEVPVTGKPGDRIQFLFSERPEARMTHDLHSEYIVGPAGAGVFRNRFNYMSGRWVTIQGSSAPPALNGIKGYQIRSGYERTSRFECSNPLLNWIYDTTLWTFENLSLGGFVVDCPQRERRGYGGDAHSTTQTALDSFGMGAFYTKWSRDWRDVQAPNGDVPYTAPTYSGGGGPTWSGFCIHLPWKMYRQYGDVQILRENFPTMRRWLAFMETHAKDGLLQRWGGEWDFLGDWLWPYDDRSGIPNGDAPETQFFDNCYWAYALETAAKIARIVGDDEAAAQYTERAATLCEAIHARFYRPATHDYANGHQNYLALALIANVPPATERAEVWKRLEEEIVVHRTGHIDAGITGGALLTRLLIEENRADLMYAMVTKSDYPSWGFFQRSGQTTIPESWDNTNSQLHSSYLFVGAWFMEGLAGIRPGPDGGFQHFVLRPLIEANPPLDYVSAHYDSLFGRIACAWTRRNGRIELEVTVPPNTVGTLYLPAMLASSISSIEGWRRSDGNTTALELQPGTYAFKGRAGNMDHG